MSETPWPIAVYLQDGRYGLRAPVPEDAEHAWAWYEGAFPISSETAREYLVEQESIPWGGNPTVRLVIIDLGTDAVVGGALVERQNNRVGKLKIVAGRPEPSSEAAQQLRAAVLRMLIPWMMGELNLMTAVLDVPSDETVVIAAAHELGLVEVVRLREHIARPSGRVDLLMLELVNRRWGRGDA